MTLSHALAATIEGWTQKKIEEATGIKQDRLSRILTGARNNKPTLEELDLIESAVGKPRGFTLGLAGLVTVEGVEAGERHYADRVGRSLGDTTDVLEQLEAAADARAGRGSAAQRRRTGRGAG